MSSCHLSTCFSMSNQSTYVMLALSTPTWGYTFYYLASHAPPCAPLKPSCGGFMVDLDPDLYICYMTAVIASLLKDAGFVGCQTFKYNHCSPLTVESWNIKNVLRQSSRQTPQIHELIWSVSSSQIKKRNSSNIRMKSFEYTFSSKSIFFPLPR